MNFKECPFCKNTDFEPDDVEIINSNTGEIAVFYYCQFCEGNVVARGFLIRFEGIENDI